MVVKKKKAKKGKKKKKAAAREENPDDAFDVPEFVDPRKFVTLEIILAEPAFAPSMKEFTDFTMEVPDTTKVDWIRRKIIEHHGGAISNVDVHYNAYDENENSTTLLDNTKRLKDCAI
jgi:hypothetical protein